MKQEFLWKNWKGNGDYMKIYDYSNLLQAVRETNTNKIIAESNRIADKKNALSKLEMELKTSGLLDDWYDLKRLCREANVRIMPYGGWDEKKQGVLMDDFQYFEDNGMFMECMSSGSHWTDYFGFSYKDREFKWKICHITSSTLFNGFDNEVSELNTKIKLIELFMERYEEYRNIQLQRIYMKIGKITEETMVIKNDR